MKTTKTGDTLVLSPPPRTWQDARLAGVDVPEPVFTCSIEGESVADERDLTAALLNLQREDPSLRVAVHEETGQRLLSGMGELHLDIVRSLLLRQYRIACTMGSSCTAIHEMFV